MTKHSERYIVYGLTQDAEPGVTPFVLTYAETLDAARTFAKDWEPNPDIGIAIYDRETGEYFER